MVDCTDLIPFLVWIVPMAGGAISVGVARLSSVARNMAAVITSLISALLATSFFFIGSLSQYTLTGNIFDDQSMCGVTTTWIQALNLNAGVLVDPLTAILANVVAWVSFLIIVYSLGYMKGERNLTRYYFLMNFFIGNMLLLVMSDNFLQLFLGWEGVGYCSYALIGFWHSDEMKYWVGTPGDESLRVPEAYSPTHAGIKAFLMTRAGDIAFLIGILLIFAYAKTFNFRDLYNMIGHSPNWATSLSSVGLFVPSALFIFGGAIGKSAQFPLHEWLPDAMAGPTSVSALIHAATMVNAGVFLVGTVGPLYVAAAHALSITYPFFLAVGAVGAFTAFLAATQAMVSDELKKVLAYSTVSQIGYMMLGLGVAGLSTEANFTFGFTAGFFHLISQALFKAGLFMCAGWLIHVAGSKYMSDMGGLWKNLKITFASMLIVGLSLAAIPPLSGFWSKDSILAAANQAGGAAYLLYGLGLVTSLITAFYTFRMLGLIFWGPKSANIQKIERTGQVQSSPGVNGREQEEASAPEAKQAGKEEGAEESHKGLHESPPSMWVPYSILAAVTVVIGVAAPFFLEKDLGTLFSSYLSNWNINSPYSINYASDIVPISISVVLVLLGSFLGYLGYIRRSINPAYIVEHNVLFYQVHKFFYHRWYINSFYYRVFVYPIQTGSRWLFGKFEEKVIDPINVEAPDFGGGVSSLLKKIQTGIEEEYIFAFGLGIALLIIVLAYFGQI
jgi:NADH-quinone oxidoreductase subunit L